jgi:hypothetical protein
MNKFINNQVKIFNGNKFSANDLIKKYLDNYRFCIVYIHNNIIDLKYNISNDFLNRKYSIIKLLKNTVKKYKINDTIFIMYCADGYCIDNLPVFNFALPDGIPGFIFPHFDIINIKGEILNDKINIINKYKPKKIVNDIYFKGGHNSKNRSKIREKLEKEKFPINVIIYSDKYEEPCMMKNHKYLFDLPGVKPWSVRFKILTFMEKLIIRISFYDPNRGETSYWKQYIDYLLKENKDYVHLIYKTNYDKEISDNLYNKILFDIHKIYKLYENNNKKYNKITMNIKKKSEKINMENTYKYIAKVINSYTENVLIMDI